MPEQRKNENEIDIVVYWVDGNDPVWQQKFDRYAHPDASTDTSASRYRDWENLKYLFRGIEKYAPWAGKIYFVTDGQIPAWMNTASPRLVCVNHSDYIPAEYLPVFNANPIELNFHRLPGIADRFIVFNDDFFIMDKTEPGDFFKDGKPVDILMEYPVMCGGNNPVFSSMLTNGFNLIGHHFDRKEYKKRLKNKILTPKYGRYFFYNLCMYALPFPRFFGLLTPHFARPYLKETFETLWQEEKEVLDATCHHRFRSSEDVNIYIFRNYNLLKGNFVPGNIHKMGKAYFIHGDTSDVIADITNKKHKLLCINDDCPDEYYEKCKKEVNDAFEKVFPDKSSFEL